jgi:hypothetical protein
MAEKNTHALEIEVTGAVASSLKQATGLSEKELKRLEEASKVMNSIIRKQTTEAFKGIEKQSHETAEKVKEDFEKMREAGERAADKIHERFEKLWDKFKEFSGISALGGVIGSAVAALSVADISKEGVAIYNTRLKLMERQRAILAAQGQAGLAPELQERIERTEGKTGFGYEQQMEAMTKIAGARPGLGAEKIGDITQQLEDLAGTPDKLDQVVSSFTGVFVKGGLSPKALKGFFEATGLNLRVELAKTFGVTPDEMTKLMGKKGMAPSQLIGGLEKTLDRLTGVGGAFQGRAKAFLETFEGIQMRWGYLWETFAAGWGHAVEDLITPIANEFLDIFTNERVAHALDEVQAWATRMGSAIKGLIGDIVGSGAIEKFDVIKRALGGIVDIFDPSKLERWMQVGENIVRVKTPLNDFLVHGFNNALDVVAEMISKIREAMVFIKDNFNTIKNTVIAIVALLAAERLAMAAITFGNAAKMGVGAASWFGKVLFGGGGAAAGEVGEVAAGVGLLNPLTAGIVGGVLAGLYSKNLTDTYKLPFLDQKTGAYHDPESLRTDDDPRSPENIKELAEKRRQEAENAKKLPTNPLRSHKTWRRRPRRATRLKVHLTRLPGCRSGSGCPEADPVVVWSEVIREAVSKLHRSVMRNRANPAMIRNRRREAANITRT